MTRLPLPGFWYGEACYRPDGSLGYWASPFHVAPDGAIVADPAVKTETRTFQTDPLGYTRGTPTGRFAGQSRIGLTGNKVYVEATGDGHVLGPSYGNNSVLFLRDGTLVQSQPGQASGLRYQADDGSIVTADASHLSPDGLLADYTELHNIRIGSDQIAGLGAIVQLLDRPGGTGPRYILEPGSCTAIRFTYTGPNQLAVYVVKLVDKQAVAFWLTVDDLHRLPKYPEAPVVIGPISVSRPVDGHLYDMGPFIHCDPAFQFRGGPGQQENVQLESADGLIVYGKFGEAGATEGYGVDANWMTSLWDASGPDEIQIWTDPRWFPRRMAVGEAHAFYTDPPGGSHQAIWLDRHTCRELRRIPFRRKMWLHALWDEFQWGPDLGIQATAMRVYDPTDGSHSEARRIEVRYEAWHRGWCRWEAHRSDVVYAHGAAQFTAASLVQRVEFYRLGGSQGLPTLPPCVSTDVPHLPPVPPPVPPPSPSPEGDLMLIDPEKEMLYYVKLLPSTTGTGLNVLLKPNGNVYSIRVGGTVSEQPPNFDGGDESCKVSGNLATFKSEDGVIRTFGIQDVSGLL